MNKYTSKIILNGGIKLKILNRKKKKEREMEQDGRSCSFKLGGQGTHL